MRAAAAVLTEGRTVPVRRIIAARLDTAIGHQRRAHARHLTEEAEEDQRMQKPSHERYG